MRDFTHSLLTQRHFFRPETFASNYKPDDNRFGVFVDTLIESLLKKMIAQKEFNDVLDPIFGPLAKDICTKFYNDLGFQSPETSLEEYLREILQGFIYEEFAMFRYELSLLCTSFVEEVKGDPILLDSLAFPTIPTQENISYKERNPRSIRGMDKVFRAALLGNCPVALESIRVNRGYRFPFYKIYNGTGLGVFECCAISYFPKLINGDEGIFLPHLEYASIFFEQKYLSSLTGWNNDESTVGEENSSISSVNINRVNNQNIFLDRTWKEQVVYPLTKILEFESNYFESMFGKQISRLCMLEKISIPLHNVRETGKDINVTKGFESQIPVKDCEANQQLIMLAEERLEEYQEKAMRSARRSVRLRRKQLNNLSPLVKF